MDTAPRKGLRTRRQILAAAADLSTVQGLDLLSFAAVAEEVGLTKAGVAAHFPSKEAMQRAVVEDVAAAYRSFLDEAALAAPGLPRLRAQAEGWLTYLERVPYRGGCFFAAAGQAFGAKPGPVREAVAASTRFLIQALEEQAELATRLGELPPDREPRMLVFQLHALAQEANLRRKLLDDEAAFRDARRALDALLCAPEEETLR